MSLRILCGVCVCWLALSCLTVSFGQEKGGQEEGAQEKGVQEEEKNYSISLTKTAETQAGQKVYEVEDKKVLAQEYTVRDGDCLWWLLRERGLLEKQNLAELLSTFKKMNRSMQNLDMIHPGEKILIPLKIVPVSGAVAEVKTVQVSELKDVSFKNYTVQPEDSLIRIIKDMYDVPEKDLYGDYLNLVRQMNPEITDVNTIYPGQMVRLPIYSPEVVRAPIQTQTQKEPESKPVSPEAGDDAPNPVGQDLNRIFTEIGEAWLQEGEHYIPFKSGGQINLKAVAFPIVERKNGHRVIVDLNSKLPPRMASLIETSWANYRVVHLTKDDNLRTSLEKTIGACNFLQVLGNKQTLDLGAYIPFRITGDWIIQWSNTDSGEKNQWVVINLNSGNTAVTPRTIKNCLSGYGVKIIDYPQGDDTVSAWTGKAESLNAGGDPASLIKTFLGLVGISYTTDEQIPVYQAQKADINMTVRADFALQVKGKKAIVDLSGLDPEVISLLQEQKVMTLSLAKEKDPVPMLASLCEFLGISFQQGPHVFDLFSGGPSQKIQVGLPGIIFSDSKGANILTTPLVLPDEINAFLAHKGYKIMQVSLS
jgi:hypothetical protein